MNIILLPLGLLLKMMYVLGVDLMYSRASIVLNFFSFSSTAKTAPLSVPALQAATRSSARLKTDGTVRVCLRVCLPVCVQTCVRDYGSVSGRMSKFGIGRVGSNSVWL